MSHSRTRKRRRSQAFGDGDDNAPDIHDVDGSDAGDNGNQHDADNRMVAHEHLPGPDRLEKEREVWDSFREEHFEAVEQMPLTLHRQFALMRELDQQAHGYMADLQPTLQKYITCRHAIASAPSFNALGGVPGKGDTQCEVTVPPQLAAEEKNSLAASPLSTNPPTAAVIALARTETIPHTPLRRGQSALITLERPSPPTGIPPERAQVPQPTREMLSHVGWLTEELLRASEEKVNLAQAAYDSVDRHIRLLDQAIREQEASISLGARPGTQLAPILLPELVVPRWARPARLIHSPTASDEEREKSQTDINMGEPDGAPLLSVASGTGPNDSRNTSHKKKGKKGSTKNSSKAGKPPEELLPEVTPQLRRTGGRSVKLTVPSQQSIQGEQPYCYCQRGSFGGMVACDSSTCKREWFHLACAGLTRLPAEHETWYCRDCAKSVSRKRR